MAEAENDTRRCLENDVATADCREGQMLTKHCLAIVTRDRQSIEGVSSR